jgi:hypothetical protein
MKMLHSLKKWLSNPTEKPSPEIIAEYQRIKRRTEKFPRLRGSAQPLIHRNALFKERYNLSGE